MTAAVTPLIPVPPGPPKSWTVTSTITYVGVAIVFVIGCLAEAGVLVPSGVSGTVSTWAGVAAQVAAAATAVAVAITHASVVKVTLSTFRRRVLNLVDSGVTVTPPVIPTSWTITSAVLYATSFALFLVGALAEAHVMLPANVSAEIGVWAGIANQVAGALAALVTSITHASLVKATMRAVLPSR